jgi:hypothetical protein
MWWRLRGAVALRNGAAARRRRWSSPSTLVELRFFGGLEAREVAGALGIAESTALRDWRAAKAWLASEIRRVNTPA